MALCASNVNHHSHTRIVPSLDAIVDRVITRREIEHARYLQDTLKIVPQHLGPL
jgi:hypothetical protein